MNDRNRDYGRQQRHGGRYGDNDQRENWRQQVAEAPPAGGANFDDDISRGDYDEYTRDYRSDRRRGNRPHSRDYEDRFGYNRQAAESYRDDRHRGEERHGNYEIPRYDGTGGTRYASFTSDDYRGREVSNEPHGYRGSDYGGGVTGGISPSNSYRPAYDTFGRRRFPEDYDERSSRDYDRRRRYGQQRGFLDRASDEVASWFGDEDAAHRREMDHSGRGPANYTRSDERIREDANDNLTRDRRVDASNITVSVSEGEITLDGTVDSRHAKRRAEDVVDHISGVRHVQNNLRVENRNAGYSSSGTTTTTSRSTDDL